MWGAVLILFFIPLVYVLWQKKSETQKRASELNADLLNLRIEVERLKIELKKTKAREADVSQKLIRLVKRVEAAKESKAARSQ
ncbi:MAG: hypothetical protein LBB51_05695 [Zoogloeaceae bacterium]|jgi:hypothetical protein|nr:hypothetical protein [Zoogloeaceae bacterium]